MNDTIKAWEYPEDDWIRMSDTFDMNMWTDDIDGKMRISIYAVRNGQTDAVFPLSSYQVIKTKDLTNDEIDENDEINSLVIRLKRVAELICIYAVRNGQTDAVFPLSSYEVIKTKEDLTDSQIDANDEIDALVIRLRRVAELICIDAGMKSRPNVLGRANEMKALIKSLEERLNK